MIRKTKKTISLMLVLCFAFIVSSVQIAAAKNNDIKEKVIYKNNNVITDVKVLEKMAKEVSDVEKVPRFSAINNNSDRFYYENGKIYRIKTSKPKQVIQQVSTIEKAGNEIDKYIADAFVTITMEERKLDQQTIENLGLQDTQKMIISEASIMSYLEKSDTAWSDSYSLKAKYTVEYDYKSSYGNLTDLYALIRSRGEVLEADSASGIYPTNDECYYRMNGATYDFSYSTPKYLGIKNYTNTQTNEYISIGEEINYWLNSTYIFTAVDGGAGSVGSNWTVYGSRGTSVTVTVDF